ncbi:MAG: M16 family metallopeptidase [Rhizobiaceae bacterium]
MRTTLSKPAVFLFVFLMGISAVIAAGTAKASDTMKFVEPSSFVLDNGLEIVVIPDHRAPVVTHMIWYKAGAADEPWGKSGIAHFLEHLLFKGTKTAKPGEFSAAIAGIGGQENAFTSVDYTAYYQKIAPESLEMVMRYESDRMQNLVLTELDVATERDVILEERRQRVDASPGSILAEALNAAVYQNHPYGIPIIGWEHEMTALTLEDAVDFYDRFYTPNNAILIVAGDVEPEEVLELAKKTYGPIKRRAEPGQRVRPGEPGSNASREVSYRDARVSIPSMRRIYLAPSYRLAEPREAEALDILATVLGGASTSRIRRGLLVDETIASNAGASYWGGFYDNAELSVYLTPLPDVDLETAEARLDTIIEDLRQNGITQEELDTARDSLIKSMMFSSDSQTSMARLYGAVLTSGGTVEDVVQWPDRMMAVTVEDVNKAARKYLDKRRSTTGYLLPETTL